MKKENGLSKNLESRAKETSAWVNALRVMTFSPKADYTRKSAQWAYNVMAAGTMIASGTVIYSVGTIQHYLK